MRLLNALIDKLQATFPPNRVVVLLTPTVFMPAAGAITVWVTTHFPGYQIPEGLVIGLAAAATLAALHLANKWLDQWQKGEPIDYNADIEQAMAEFGPEIQADPETLYKALGTMQGIGVSLEDLRSRVQAGTVNDVELGNGIAAIEDVVSGFLHQHIGHEEAPAPPAAPAE